MNNLNAWPPPAYEYGAMDLEGWMAIASWSLPEDAAARVCEEAFEDYSRAYESATRDGMPEAAARAWALTVLGDPYVANHSHRNSRLSDRNAILAEQASGTTFVILMAMFTVVCGLMVFGGVWNWFDPKSDHEQIATVLVITGLLYVVAMIVAYRQRQQAKQFWEDAKASAQSSLDKWINEATRLLCASAKQRVRREVTSHYEAARAQLLGNGSSEHEAEAHALETLGDAKLAWRNFCRAYFTTAEVDMIRNFYLRPWGLKARAFTAFISTVILTVLIYRIATILATPATADWQDVRLIGSMLMVVGYAPLVVIGRGYPRVALTLHLTLWHLAFLCMGSSMQFDPTDRLDYEHIGAVAEVFKYPFAAMGGLIMILAPFTMVKLLQNHLRKLKDPDNRRELGL